MQGPHTKWMTRLTWYIVLHFLMFLPLHLLFDDKTNFYKKNIKPNFCHTRWNFPRFFLYKTAPVVLIISQVGLLKTFPAWDLTVREAFYFFSFSSVLTSILYSLISDDMTNIYLGKKMSEVQFLTNQIKRPSFPPL